MSSIWNKDGKEVEWTDFGFNAFFASSQPKEEVAPNQKEVIAPPAATVRDRRKERPKEELRALSKSPAPLMKQTSKEGRLGQKSRERSVQIGKQ